jgi:hypothetical protein
MELSYKPEYRKKKLYSYCTIENLISQLCRFVVVVVDKKGPRFEWESNVDMPQIDLPGKKKTLEDVQFIENTGGKYDDATYFLFRMALQNIVSFLTGKNTLVKIHVTKYTESIRYYALKFLFDLWVDYLDMVVMESDLYQKLSYQEEIKWLRSKINLPANGYLLIVDNSSDTVVFYTFYTLQDACDFETALKNTNICDTKIYDIFNTIRRV